MKQHALRLLIRLVERRESRMYRRAYGVRQSDVTLAQTLRDADQYEHVCRRHDFEGYA